MDNIKRALVYTLIHLTILAVVGAGLMFFTSIAVRQVGMWVTGSVIIIGAVVGIFLVELIRVTKKGP